MKGILTVCLVFIWTLTLSQSRTIQGTVTDKADQQGMPGVNVIVQGTSKGVATDVVGHYAINLDSNESILVFTFIGYKSQTITANDRTTIDVSLEADTQTLSEVVVVGYGTQKKSDITGATGNVKGEDLARQPVLTATQAAQGKLAGVQIISSGQPGSSPQIRIRGTGTALSGTTTLYVVDGVLTDDISNINTADIVDMNILKDASAAAIYGSRGANGVVIITTRKGSGKMTVNYNGNVGIRQAANLVPMASSAEYANYYQAATGKTIDATQANTNWYGTILRNAIEQTHNVSISGSSDKNSYLLNVGYLNDEGIVIKNRFKRLTVRFNDEYSISSAVKVGLQSSFGSSSNHNGFNNLNIDANGNIGGVYNDAYRAAPVIPSIVNGKYGNTSAYQSVGNPLLDINSNDVLALENRLQGSTYLEVKPLPWITLKSSFGGDLRGATNRLYNYRFLNDESTFLTAGGAQTNPRSSLNYKTNQSFRWVWDNTATATRKFGKHDFTILVGTTAERFNLMSFSASRKDVPADPNLWYINTGDANSSQNDGSGDAWSRNSYLARINYGFDERFLLTVTVRQDGSSRLPAQNRWQTYPSVGAAWVLTNEKFMSKQTLFDFLKLRASYGKVGNDQIPTNSYTQTVQLNTPYPFGGNSVTSTNGGQINQIIDPNITWENTEERDAATEFSLLGSRLTGEVNVYDKRVHNALINVPIPGTVGDADGIITTNAATIQNKGVEVTLTWKERLTDRFQYHIGGNVTFNHNGVLNLNGGEAIFGGSIGAAQGYTTLTDNGHPVGSFYVLQVQGVFNSDAEVAAYVGPDGKPIQPTAHAGDFKYLDKNNDGKIGDEDRVFAGSYQPVAYYGIDLGFQYGTKETGTLDFGVTLYGNVGNHVYNGKKAVRLLATDNVERDVVYNRWTAENHSQTEPRANSGALPASTYFVESGTFLRINNITIGYNFPQRWLDSIKLSGLRVFATSQNLFTFKKYSGFTAELPGDPLTSGIELATYPTTRTIALGLNASF